MTDCAELFENGTEVVSANCAILRPATTITQTVVNCSCYEARGHAVMMSLVGPTTTSMLEMLADLVWYVCMYILILIIYSVYLGIGGCVRMQICKNSSF